MISLGIARRISIIVSTLFAVCLPLGLWRVIYPTTDWAILAIGVLALWLFLSNYLPYSALYRARIALAIRASSPIANFFTGRFKAVVLSGGFVLISVTIMAWQALKAAPEEVLVLSVLVVFVSALSAFIRRELSKHLKEKFDTPASVAASTLIGGLLFLPFIAWINLSYIPQPGELRNYGFAEALMLGIEELPDRRGLISEVLSVFGALDAAKVWITAQLGFRSGAIIYSIDAALVSLVFARASALLTHFIEDSVLRAST